MSRVIRYLSRCSAYLIALLLAAVWIIGALDTFSRPLLDLGRPHVGDVLISLAGALAIPPHAIFPLAKLLAALKFMVGAFLLAALIGAVLDKGRGRGCDDATLDVALFIAGLASVAAALPGLGHGGDLLVAPIGELMLCLIASGLAIYGRGYLVRDELPRPVRPAFGYPRIS
ncbi:MAG TPA: hypothetical protein VJT13_20675 [Xanthobacteraceae bacterium]|nr:hypothetical protein [Xanthobacteraceae bacterium]